MKTGRSDRYATVCAEAEVIASAFDEPAARHVQVTEMVIEKAKDWLNTSEMW